MKKIFPWIPRPKGEVYKVFSRTSWHKGEVEESQNSLTQEKCRRVISPDSSWLKGDVGVLFPRIPWPKKVTHHASTMVAEGWSEICRFLKIMREFSTEFLTVNFHEIILHFFFTNNSIAVSVTKEKILEING